MRICPHCRNTLNQAKNGHNRNGSQRYLCHTCGISYTLFPDHTSAPLKPEVRRHPCPYCHSATGQIKYGLNINHGSQRYKCKVCGGTYAVFPHQVVLRPRKRKRAVGVQWDSHACLWKTYSHGKYIGRFKTIKAAEAAQEQYVATASPSHTASDG